MSSPYINRNELRDEETRGWILGLPCDQPYNPSQLVMVRVSRSSNLCQALETLGATLKLPSFLHRDGIPATQIRGRARKGTIRWKTGNDRRVAFGNHV